MRFPDREFRVKVEPKLPFLGEKSGNFQKRWKKAIQLCCYYQNTHFGQVSWENNDFWRNLRTFSDFTILQGLDQRFLGSSSKKACHTLSPSALTLSPLVTNQILTKFELIMSQSLIQILYLILAKMCIFSSWTFLST